MLVADLVFSPDDGGWYAQVWMTDGKNVAVVPEGDAVCDTRAALVRKLRKEYGTIEIREPA